MKNDFSFLINSDRFYIKCSDFSFGYAETNQKVNIKHPFNSQFLCGTDLTFNIILKVRWINLGLYYLSNISSSIAEVVHNTTFDYEFEEFFTKTKKLHIFYIKQPFQPAEIIKNDQDIAIFIKNLFENNDIILSLKLNLNEYLVLSSEYTPFLSYNPVIKKL